MLANEVAPLHGRTRGYIVHGQRVARGEKKDRARSPVSRFFAALESRGRLKASKGG